eukprot:CAMPEP_0175854194 /NCGR_PEP_ID=MMETSP0107_2-20121207/27227_1 /TAXON_ID=195067 ORGANISM="Goniomonas pacifica, Strain CCMP1869" /NCGR_SAMPLE_ID=MMETSP0107_2 /ASSEMBLY_ACC=CAM_ASM_000203 /LENGTH=57 /DNA_ID=CAMNT_0017170001 /DNA_START=346 /DNA_END=516 /DNA_ORIENTATION=+
MGSDSRTSQSTPHLTTDDGGGGSVAWEEMLLVDDTQHFDTPTLDVHGERDSDSDREH